MHFTHSVSIHIYLEDRGKQNKKPQARGPAILCIDSSTTVTEYVYHVYIIFFFETVYDSTPISPNSVMGVTI